MTPVRLIGRRRDFPLPEVLCVDEPGSFFTAVWLVDGLSSSSVMLITSAECFCLFFLERDTSVGLSVLAVWIDGYLPK